MEAELEQRKLIDKQKGKWQFINPNDNPISQIIDNPSNISVNIIMNDIPPEKRTDIFDNLFGQSGITSLNGVTEFISCRNQIRKFIDQHSESVYAPFMEQSEIDDLVKEIGQYRQEYRNYYDGKPAGCSDPKFSDLEFMNKCEWAKNKLKENKLKEKNNSEHHDFWEKAVELLTVCRKVAK